MWTRRIGAACATAHRSVPADGLIDRFSADRQKFWVALPSNQPASTVTSPLMRHVVGVRPETGDRGVEADVGVDAL